MRPPDEVSGPPIPGSPGHHRQRLIAVADNLGLHGATVTAFEEMANQDADLSSARLDCAEALIAEGGAWG